MFLIEFQNGVFGFELLVPPSVKKSYQEGRPANIYAQLILSKQKNIKLTRIIGYPMDTNFVIERNIIGKKTLKDLKIAVIGCGTIGGYLSRLLVQVGAGAIPRGNLLLIDNDRLLPGNFGRHLLGPRHLCQYKAQATAELLNDDFPESRVHYENKNVLALLKRLETFDLIIDATGEEALSYAINKHFVALKDMVPTILYVWLEGNGASARSFLYTDKNDACYRCLRPRFDKPEKFKALKGGATTRTVEATACGDSAYTPYSAAASTTAAALALEMALDFINDHPTPKFRTRIINENDAQSTKNQNVTRDFQCPACK